MSQFEYYELIKHIENIYLTGGEGCGSEKHVLELSTGETLKKARRRIPPEFF
jgi:hypothetical protein